LLVGAQVRVLRQLRAVLLSSNDLHRGAQRSEALRGLGEATKKEGDSAGGLEQRGVGDTRVSEDRHSARGRLQVEEAVQRRAKASDARRCLLFARRAVCHDGQGASEASEAHQETAYGYRTPERG
jgi:hypothetical protein